MKQLIILFLLVSHCCFSQESFFRYNLVGYLPDEAKSALFISKKPLNRLVAVVRALDEKQVHLISPKPQPLTWEPFGYYYDLDFTRINEPGTYYLKTTDGSVQSGKFIIGNYPSYQEDILFFMRTQRCGYNPYLDKECHQLDGRTFFGPKPDSSYLDARGGWHDAGDQLKYLITGSNATARMLLAYEWAPDKFGDQVNALGKPGANGVPDVLDEARWGLDWIHNLHPEPGHLYHQVADDRDHRGFKLPHQDNADYGWGPNSQRPVYFATGKPQGAGKYQSEATGIANIAGRSAAAMALGYRHFFKLDKEYAKKCLKAAEDLYQMGKEKEGYQQGNSYGAPYRYMEDTWADDMEWAAAELYKATKGKKYLNDALRYAKMAGTTSWMEMDTAAHYQMYPYNNLGHYVLWEAGPGRFKKELSDYYKHNLARIQKKGELNPYGVGHLFIWCSNNLAVSVVTQAYLYERMTGDTQFRPLMLAHRDWLLGRNPWGTSMFTGIPEKGDTPVDVHMPFWRLQKKQIPGSLVDGPLWESIHGKMLGIKLSQPDEYAAFQPPHIKYHDDWADYSTNEPTMDGSADAIFMMALFSRTPEKE
jgi:endoglucanase